MTVEPIAALRDTFLRRIDAHEVYIGIIGQGYVGLPLALRSTRSTAASATA